MKMDQRKHARIELTFGFYPCFLIPRSVVRPSLQIDHQPAIQACYLRMKPVSECTEMWAMKFERITIDPRVCTGKACIRGLRFPVSRLLGLLASRETKETILKAYPFLEPEDIDEALRYAAYLAEEETVEFVR
jgi:uncharacterized protein (DUF433 family)